ncbi:hypothetical protein BH11BAC7_BH11BAC7_11520 [soil metagenome]
MAIANIVVTVVDVGQGQCTFVEVYDTTPALIHTLLFDCGTNHRSPSEGINLDYIVAKVSGMATPAFDCIFFSHSDTDHTNLTANLLLKFTPAKKPTVKKVWYGGDRDHYTVIVGSDLFNILDYLVANNYCLTTDIFSPDPDKTDYADPNTWTGTLWKTGDGTTNVQVYSLIANVLKTTPETPVTGTPPRKRRKVAEAANRVSIVCGLYYAGASYVICGDATNKTMATINTAFVNGTTFFDNNHMTTAPHHGSRKTGFAVPSSAKASATTAKNVTDFAALVKSRTMTLSVYDHHKHPSLELVNSFIPTITSPFLKDTRFTPNTHRIVLFNNTNNSIVLVDGSGTKLYNDYYGFDTPTCTFSTWYSRFTYNTYKLGEALVGPYSALVTPLTAINPNACWRYEISADGSWSVGGYANLSLPLAIFTGATTTSVAGMAAVTAETKTTEQEASAIEIKRSIQKPRPPAQMVPQFRRRLKQFH